LRAAQRSAQEDFPSASTCRSAAAAPKVDPGVVGVWGVDSQGGHEFKAGGTFIMEGTVNYKLEAADGAWHCWFEVSPKSAVTAECKLSADKKTLQINLKKGNSFTKLIRVK
jgi:hypothetical protein